jgi:phenylpropionate dioxygenase-like ring-hydroxylating dioxygenase large terminal subunit
MVSNTPFLNVPYGGYLHNQIPIEDEELTHVGPGTPGGEWLRRYWHPVFAVDELKDLPVAIRIMGEDLVIFRDGSGQIGLLELHCSHRGTSLEFGQIEERGIRCCYHAWLYAADGTILETPGEPADSTLKDRLCHGAYPTLECGGLVFAYMGSREKQPAFPYYDTYSMAGHYTGGRMHKAWPCNWLQMMENVHDPIHLFFLHTIEGNEGFSEDFAQVPESDFVETPLGMVYIDTRRVGDRIWVRVSDFIVPNLHKGCDIKEAVEDRNLDDVGRPILSQWMVPVDDTHTQRFDIWYAPVGQEIYKGEATYGQQPGSYKERQRTPGDYDALTSQRPIAIHALEHLGNTDMGVIMGRNIVRKGIRAVQNGQDPLGISYEEGVVIPTFSQERFVFAPPVETPRADRKLLRDAGRKVVDDFIKEPVPR